MDLVSAFQMQQMDRKTIEEFTLPGRVLMENAGRGATQILLESIGDLTDKSVGVIAGTGNNGGDGYVIARYLAGKGISVSVYIIGGMNRVKGDALTNLELLPPLNVPVFEVKDQKDLLEHKKTMLRRDIWVDAIFGTGLNTEITGFYRMIIDFINSLERPTLAVDIPSGVHPDNGQILGVAINAHLTVTFGYAKTGLFLFPGAGCAGDIHVIDIGIPPHIAGKSQLNTHLITPDMIHGIYRGKQVDGHKGLSGHVMMVAGSRGKSGAAALCAEAAMRAGAGLVTLGIPESLNPVMETLIKEVMTLPLAESKSGILAKNAIDDIRRNMPGKRCLAFGPGMGLDSHTISLIHALMDDCPIPVVMDADALNALDGGTGRLRDMAPEVILTPHPKEMSRMTSLSVEEILKDRVKVARDFAVNFKVHLVLKSARTIIAHPDGQVFINPTGNPLLSSGGTGDVLTGIIAGLICQGYPATHATHLGVFLHGLVADMLAEERGPVGILASEMSAYLPHAMARIANRQLAPLPFIFQRL